MRKPSDNPFLPGADRVPAIWAGRRLDIADFNDIVRPRRTAGVHERGRAVLGEFGIGKSALVNRLADEANALGDWVPAKVRVAMDADVFDLVGASLASFIQDRSSDARIGRSADRLLGRISDLRLPGGVGVGLRDQTSGTNSYRMLLDVILDLATMAHEEGRLLLLRIDEIQNVTDRAAMSQLLTVLGDALEASVSKRDAAGVARDVALPLAVYVSGLPDFHDLAAQAGATFSRRFKTVELQPLSETDIRAALQPFTDEGWQVLADDGPKQVLMQNDVVSFIAAKSLGDPFLFQLAGEVAWNAGTSALITLEEAERGWAGALREVQGYVDARLRGLTDLQMEVLQVAAAIPAGDRSGGNVARAAGRTSSAAIASTTRALDVEHRLIRRQAGKVSFRSPAVEAYLAGQWP